MLKLIIGRAGTGKTSRILREITDSSSDGGGITLIVPEQYSHEAVRELALMGGDRVSLYAEVVSFTRLCARVSEEVGGFSADTLDKGGRLLTMALTIESVYSGLSFYSGARSRAQLQLELLSAVDELKIGCVTPEQLSEAAELAEGTLRAKLRDMALILAGFDALISRGKSDPADRLTRLAENIADSSYCNGGGRIYIDGFVDFTAQERAVLDELFRCDADLTVCFTCDDLNSGSGEVFDASRRAAKGLIAAAERYGRVCEVEYMPETTAGLLAELTRQLFEPTEGVELESGGAVSLHRARDLYTECEFAAAAARRLVRETGCRWRDIAVAARGFDDYASALESAFLYYDVPLYVSRRVPITERSAPAQIFAAREVLSGGWDYESVSAYLRIGLLGLEAEDVDLLENYVYLWNLRGESVWTRREPWVLHPDGSGKPVTERSIALLERIDDLRRRVASPLARLSRRSRVLETASQHAIALADFLVELELPETLQKRAETQTSRGNLTLAAEYEQTWEKCVSALEQCAQILGDSPMDFERFFDYYKLVLSQYEIGTIPIGVDRVTAGDFDRMRRRNIRHLIVLGASDARLPRSEHDTGVFTYGEREQLSELGIELGDTGETGVYREMGLIYNCLSLPSETLMVSYSAGSSSGESEQPSFVIRRLAVMLGLEPEEVDSAYTRTFARVPSRELAAAYYGGEDGALFRAVSEYLEEREPAEADRLRSVTELVRGALSRESARALYGSRPRLSSTRLETLNACRFKHFLEYGLRASPRKREEFQAPQLGSFMHFVLEGIARDVRTRGGFSVVSASEIHAISDVHIASYVRERLMDFEGRNERFRYLFNRLTDSVHTVAEDLARELGRSDFEPLDFELYFGGEELAPLDIRDGSEVLASLTGIADRVDGWLHDGKLYLRVIDYKTGQRKFDLSDLWYGAGLQMLLYLFSLEQVGSERYGHEVVPARRRYSVPV